MFSSLSVRNFAQKLPNGFARNFQKRLTMASEQKITYLCRCRTDSPDGGTDVATLLRRALAKVCNVPVLLVAHVAEIGERSIINQRLLAD